MDVGVVNARDLRIGHNYERKVSKCLNAMGKADGDQGETEVGRGKKGVRGEGRPAMSGNQELAIEEILSVVTELLH